MLQIAHPISQIEAPPIAEAMGWVRHSASNRDLLNLCQAVPSYPPADDLQAEIARLARDPTIGGYTPVLGIQDLRAAHAEHLSSDYKARIASTQIGITTGCNQAFAAAIMAVAQAGDNVIMPLPSYFNHNMWLRMLGVTGVGFPAFSDEAAYPLAKQAAELINARTRAIVLCTPNNPTGQIYPAEVIKAFYDLAKAHGIALILDETYKDFRPNPTPPHALFNEPDWDQTLIQLYSFSKIYALAGYRLGSIAGSERLLQEAEKILDCMTICPPHITQRAVIFGLRELADWKNGKRALMRGRLEALRDAFGRASLTYRLVSSGAYFAYVQHPFEGELSKSVAKRLAQEHDLLCLPGSMFGANQEKYLRLAFANVDAELMPRIVERLAESQ